MWVCKMGACVFPQHGILFHFAEIPIRSRRMSYLTLRSVCVRELVLWIVDVNDEWQQLLSVFTVLQRTIQAPHCATDEWNRETYALPTSSFCSSSFLTLFAFDEMHEWWADVFMNNVCLHFHESAGKSKMNYCPRVCAHTVREYWRLNGCGRI